MSMTMQELEELVEELSRLRAKRDKLDKKIESIETQIKDYMTETEKYEYEGDDWKVSWNLVTSNRFDQKAFQSAHPKLFDQFKKVSESRRFYLSQ